MGPKLLEETQIPHQVLQRLVGRAHHEPRPHLVAQLFQLPQALQAVGQGELRRVELLVVAGGGRLVAEQVPVGPGLFQQAVALLAALPHGKGDGAVRPALLDGPDHGAQALVGEPGVLSALEHKGAESQPIARLAAGEDLLLAQAVALGLGVAPADAAVVAVVFAEVGKLNQPPDEHLAAIESLGLGLGLLPQELPGVGAAVPQEQQQLAVLQVVAGGQSFRQLLEGAHFFTPA